MRFKPLLIKLSALIPLMLIYLYPADRSISGKGILIPAHSADLMATVSGPFLMDIPENGNWIKKGEKLFEVGYSDDRGLLLLGLRGPRVSLVDDQIAQLKRTQEVLDHVSNPAFAEEQKDILKELQKQNRLKGDLSKKWPSVEVKDRSVILTAPDNGFLIRTAGDPQQGEYVNEGRHLGQFVEGGDLRIVVLYPYGVLPDVQNSKADVEIKVPQHNGRVQVLNGKPLTGPLMGMDLWEYLQDTGNYITSVRTKENKQLLEQSFGVLYEIHNPPVDYRVILNQEVEAKIRRTRATLISLWVQYAWLSWHIFTQQAFKEPMLALQCFLSAVNFWLAIPFLPFAIYFSGIVPEELRKRYKESQEAHIPPKPLRVSAVVPFFNEGKVILSTIDSLARQEYPLEQIFLVDDGSTDDFFSLIQERFKLKKIRMESMPVVDKELRVKGKKRDIHTFRHLGKQFVLIRKENAGKGYALNCGINRVSSDYVVTLDGDTLLDPNSIMLLAYAMYKDPRIKVTHGRLGVMNNCVVKDGVVVQKRLPRDYVEMCQVVEYFGNGMAKAFHNALGVQTVIVGAFACYEIQMLREVGGFHNRTIVEDQDIAYEIHKKTAGMGVDDRTNIIYVPRAVAWTQVPFNWKNLYRQRLRWAGGSLDTLMKHSEMIFKPKYGWLSLYSMPMAWFNYVVFWLTLPLNIFGIVGLAVNLYLFSTSDIWRWLIHYYFFYFFLPGILYSVYFWIYDYVYMDGKYIKSWNAVQKVIIFLFARFGYLWYGYILSYFRFIGHMKAFFSKLTWEKIERKTVKG